MLNTKPMSINYSKKIKEYSLLNGTIDKNSHNNLINSKKYKKKEQVSKNKKP